MLFKEYVKLFLFIIAPLIIVTVILLVPICLIQIVWLKISCSIVFIFIWTFVAEKFIEKMAGRLQRKKK